MIFIFRPQLASGIGLAAIHKRMKRPPDLPAIGADDDLDDASVRRLLKDIFPEPEDPLTHGLKKGEQYKLARLFFPKNDEHDEESVTA